MRQTSVAQLHEALHRRLALTHVCGRLEAVIRVSEERIWPADLVGHLNLIHPQRLQILGAAELAWARRQSREKIAMVMRVPSGPEAGRAGLTPC